MNKQKEMVWHTIIRKFSHWLVALLLSLLAPAVASAITKVITIDDLTDAMTVTYTGFIPGGGVIIQETPTTNGSFVNLFTFGEPNYPNGQTTTDRYNFYEGDLSGPVSDTLEIIYSSSPISFGIVTVSVNFISGGESSIVPPLPSADSLLETGSYQQARSILPDVLIQMRSDAEPSSTTPEPATLTLLGIGIAGLAGYRLRRRKMAAA